ncbi:hypothetical protein BC829DRAFT_445577 [Chytridium lagenaria]|nr:hypothetical protein BC829DRAFT_445577 [Chytridium lagenaria]
MDDGDHNLLTPLFSSLTSLQTLQFTSPNTASLTSSQTLHPFHPPPQTLHPFPPLPKPYIPSTPSPNPTSLPPTSPPPPHPPTPSSPSHHPHHPHTPARSLLHRPLPHAHHTRVPSFGDLEIVPTPLDVEAFGRMREVAVEAGVGGCRDGFGGICGCFLGGGGGIFGGGGGGGAT